MQMDPLGVLEIEPLIENEIDNPNKITSSVNELTEFDVDKCRICLEPVDIKDYPKVFRPCMCTQPLHMECLQTQLEIKYQEKCEICRQPYLFNICVMNKDLNGVIYVPLTFPATNDTTSPVESGIHGANHGFNNIPRALMSGEYFERNPNKSICAVICVSFVVMPLIMIIIVFIMWAIMLP